MTEQNEIVGLLFETGAFRVCAPEQPFWYTSGLFGPYYVNTHFLFGGEAEARHLLAEIESLARPEKRADFVRELGVWTLRQYEQNTIYRAIIDHCVAAVKDQDFDFVSGGERRDFFFSLEVARRLGLPHLAIFKDLGVWYAQTPEQTSWLCQAGDLAGQKALHVADLITEASSYFRAWIPAIEAVGACLSETLAVVDRCQGGVELLAKVGVVSHTLVRISPELFDEAQASGLIDEAQKHLLNDYFAHPHGFVQNYLKIRPDFLEKAAARDAQTAERVARLRVLLSEKKV